MYHLYASLINNYLRRYIYFARKKVAATTTTQCTIEVVRSKKETFTLNLALINCLVIFDIPFDWSFICHIWHIRLLVAIMQQTILLGIFR